MLTTSKTRTNGRPAVVLLVDDDLGDQELARRAMEDGDIRTDIHTANDGQEALDFLLRAGRFEGKDIPTPDLILLDLNMPKLDGKQVLREMRKHPKLRRIPVVALTTSDSESDIRQTYELGANSYITKPQGIDELTDAMSQLKRYWFRIVALPPLG